ncbi:MAG: dockerin type I repeat-containing protein, partial [Bacteroidales bacterium]|nr:dockerin type I repeat-containing protein [Candidatus Sodaliphilus fimicaballi]
YSTINAQALLATHTETASSVISPALEMGDLVVSRTKADFQNHVVTNSVASKLWYSRPAGTLGQALSGYFEVQNSGWRYMTSPVLYMPPFTPVTFLNRSTDKASTEWMFLQTKTSAIPYNSYQVTPSNDFVLTAGAGRALYYIPAITRGEERFFFGDEAPKVSTYATVFMTDTLCDMGFEEIAADIEIHQGTSQSYYVGRVTDRIDFNQDGKKETVYMDGFHMFYPKPVAPLAVNRIVIPITSYSGEFFTGFEGVTLTLYKVKTTPSGYQSFGDVIYTTELTDDNFAQAPGVLIIGRQAHLVAYLTDDEKGFLTLDEPFALELKGFQREGVELGTRLVLRMAAAQNSPEALPYLYRDYVNKQGEYVGSTTYSGNNGGVPISFYGAYDVMLVDAKANAINVESNGTTCTSNATVYTTRDWKHYTLDELPEWVKSVNATTGDYGVHTLAVECEPLPAGAATRSCTVHLKSFAGNLSNDVITITQEGGTSLTGDVNGDGTVDIADVNAVIDIVLGLQGSTAAADVNGDGTVDVADINQIINIILGL